MESHGAPEVTSNTESIYPDLDDTPLPTWQANQVSYTYEYDGSEDELEDSDDDDDMEIEEMDETSLGLGRGGFDPHADTDDSAEDATYNLSGENST